MTGLGVVSPVGCSLRKSWDTVLGGGCGIVQLKDEYYTNLPCQVAAIIRNDSQNGKLDLAAHFSTSQENSQYFSFKL